MEYFKNVSNSCCDWHKNGLAFQDVNLEFLLQDSEHVSDVDDDYCRKFMMKPCKNR